MRNFIASRKFAWGAGIFFVALYFGPSLLRSFTLMALRPALTLQQKTGKPSPSIPAQPIAVPVAAGISTAAAAVVPLPSAPPSPSTPTPAAIAADDPALARFLGIWVGNVAIPNRAAANRPAACMLRLEVRDSHDKDHPFAGFSTLSCAPSMFEMLDKRARHETPAGMVDDMMKQMNPTDAILAGSLAGGSVQFQVQKNVGVAEASNGCPMSSMTITPFGAEQLDVDWKESQQGSCQGGELLVKKTPR